MLRESRPRGEVGMGALLCPRSIPRWSASETQDRRQAETQRARTKKILEVLREKKLEPKQAERLRGRMQWFDGYAPLLAA